MGIETVEDVTNNLPAGALRERDIEASVCERYGMRVAYDEGTGDDDAYYFPLYKGGRLVGYQAKRAKAPGMREKGDVWRVGETQGVDPFGSHVTGNKGSFVIVTEGGEDCLAAVQMLQAVGKRYRVVSTLGADGWKRTLPFFEGFQKVVIAFDNDTAGIEAALEFSNALKPGQGHVLRIPEGYSDPNDMLLKRKYAEFIEAINTASVPKPIGIIPASETWDLYKDRRDQPYVPYPPEWKLMCKKAYGMRLGEISMWTSGCVDADTEYLSPAGWRRIADYDGGLVMTYNPHGTSAFEKPSHFTNVPAEGLVRFTTAYGVDQVLSPGHRVLYENKHGAWLEKPFHEVAEAHQSAAHGWQGKFRTTFSYGGIGLYITDGELRLQVAVMADGRIVNGGKGNYTQMRFKKERKYTRLLNLCRKYDLRHDDRGCKDGVYEVIVWPKWSDKRYSHHWYCANKEELLIILDEMRFWDGTEDGRFCSSHKEDADFIQYAYAATGIRSTINIDRRSDNPSYNVQPAGNSRVGISGRTKARLVPFTSADGRQYCFTVSTGALVLRRNGKVFITGNTGMGKTSLMRELKLHILQTTQFRIGDISLEEGVGDTVQGMMELVLEKRIGLPDVEVTEEEERKAWHKLCANDRLYFVKHEGRLEEEGIISKIRYLVHSVGCQVIFLDHITMAVSETSDGMAGQDKFMNELSRIVKGAPVHIAVISHLRKTTSGAKSFEEGAIPTDDDLKGSGSLKQVSFDIIALSRNKMAEDPIQRNLAHLNILKCRRTGRTGKADTLLYDDTRGRLEVYDAPEPPEEESL